VISKSGTARGASPELRGIRFSAMLALVLTAVAGAATGQLALISIMLGGFSFGIVAGVWGISVVLPESRALLGKRARRRLLNWCLAIAALWFVFAVVGVVREEIALWFTLAAAGPVALATWCAGALGKAR
jgi:hypothetical protein